MTTPVDTATERHRAIAGRLEAVGRVDVADLAARLEVAPETIRRDLRVLEQQGRLQRVHGGAVRKPDHPLSPFDGDSPVYPEAQRDLAERVVSVLPTRGTLFLGASPLTAAVADALARHVRVASTLTVVTTSLDAAVVLSRVDHLSVFNVGGTVDQHDRAQLGDWALTEIGRLRTDLALIPADGLGSDGSVFSATAMGAAMTAAAIDAAARVWLLVDAAGLGRRGFMAVTAPDRIDRVFLTGRADPDILACYERTGIHISSAPGSHREVP